MKGPSRLGERRECGAVRAIAAGAGRGKGKRVPMSAGRRQGVATRFDKRAVNYLATL
jgi:hypothetical protein